MAAQGVQSLAVCMMSSDQELWLPLKYSSIINIMGLLLSAVMDYLEECGYVYATWFFFIYFCIYFQYDSRGWVIPSD